MREVLLIRITGKDRPGITAALSEILASHGADILDIGQAVIHDRLLLGLLVELAEEDRSAHLLKELMFHTQEAGLDVHFEPVSPGSYTQWQAGSGKDRHIITLLTRRVSGAQLARISTVISAQGLNIADIKRLSGRVPLDDTDRRSKACVELVVRGSPLDPDAMRAAFMQIANELDVDIAFQEDSVFRRHRRLVVFDMDSTLIETEVIDELAREAGVGEEVGRVTEQAMRGELDFAESLTARVALLKGLDAAVLEKIAERLPLTEGVERLISTLKSVGYKTAILSGGFRWFGERLQERLGIDYVYANQLEIVDGKVTGRVVGDIIDGARKAELLCEIAEREGIRLDQVIAVGDGANDLPMLAIAGLGIAFRAKPIVRESARQAISTLGLDGVLYLLGFTDLDIEG